MNTDIQERTIQNRQLIIDQLKKTPIIQTACNKINISRSTYYRWKEEDKKFGKEADEALLFGKNLINDLAESQLLSAIKDKNMTAIIYWLKHHHADYSPKIEISTKRIIDDENLTDEQKNHLQKALKLARLSADDS
jgi:hypothetical protein